MAKQPAEEQIVEASAEALTKSGEAAEKIAKGNAEALNRKRQRLKSRRSGVDEGVSGIGIKECQAPNCCDAGAGRSEKPDGVHRIAAEADQGRG